MGFNGGVAEGVKSAENREKYPAQDKNKRVRELGDTGGECMDRLSRKPGFLTKLKRLLTSRRVGELLVINGTLTPCELRYALSRQRDSGQRLGNILLDEKFIRRHDLYGILAQQFTLRCLMAATTLFLAFSVFGTKTARAATIKDVAASINLVSAANAAFAPVSAYPALFGQDERRSSNLEPFSKWTAMFTRFDRELNQPANHSLVEEWREKISPFKGLPLEEMVSRVNAVINEQTYITDNRLWGRSDYWATPVEFFQRGGDCEDFAIAKYASLRALGVPENRMRVAIVHDKIKDIPHALLIVYTDTDALILDNQSEDTLSSRDVTRYRPIFSINREAWWLHTAPGKTVVASAE